MVVGEHIQHSSNADFRQKEVNLHVIVKTAWRCFLPVNYLSVCSEGKPNFSGNTILVIQAYLIGLKSTITCSIMQNLVMFALMLAPFKLLWCLFYVVYQLTGNSCYGSSCNCPVQSGHPARWHRRRKSVWRHQSTPIIKRNVWIMLYSIFYLSFLDIDVQIYPFVSLLLQMNWYAKWKLMQKLHLCFSKFGPVWFQVVNNPI